jgi:hypothetical protein
MKKLLRFLFLFLILNSCSEPGKPESKREEPKIIPDTIEVEKAQKDNVRSEFDYDSVEVVIASYKKPRPVTNPILGPGRTIGPKCRGVKTLSRNQAKRLYKILFRTPFSHGGPICVGNPANGYFPMHCIFFKDKKTGKYFDYLELYFKNHNYEANNWLKFDIRDCSEYDSLKKFFQSCGIMDGYDIKNTMSAADSALYIR